MSKVTNALHRENIVYKVDGKDHEGTLVYDGSVRGRRPGVLVCHAWMGLDPYTRRRAVQIARLGYCVFALDMYGGGALAQNPDEAGKLMAPLRADRTLLRARAAAGLRVLREQRLAASRNIVALGYCFGGMVVLEMARAGEDLRAVISFHGLLDTGLPAAGKIKPRVLALHGAEDSLVPPKQVAAFQDEMRAGEADWQFISYGGAMHAFTNPEANDPNNGVLHHPASERRSWQAMKTFLAESFSE